jgi:hypothetical protein
MINFFFFQRKTTLVKMAHFRGKLVSSGEVWEFDQGKISSPVGNFKNYSFLWEKNTFSCPDSAHLGYGCFDAASGRVNYYFPHYSKSDETEQFFSYSIKHSPSSAEFNCENILWYDKISWTYDKSTKVLSFVPPNQDGWFDRPEGHTQKWELQGDIPLLVALIMAMFSRTQTLHRLRLESLMSSMTRCNRFVGPVGKSLGFLCEKCAATGQCASCNRPHAKIQGVSCKSCSIRLNFCAKCSQSRGNSSAQAYLCSFCGMGKLVENCARMGHAE